MSHVLQTLSGKRILLTGGTGFVGQALLERLLAIAPETHVVLLLRPQFGRPAGERLARLLRSDVFQPFRHDLGEANLARRARERIEMIDADLAVDIPDLPSDLDIVLHCAAVVSFDAPVDRAMQVNVLGTERLYRGLQQSGSRAHVVHVSTTYVGGLAAGVVREERLEHALDWRAEAAAGLQARVAAEADSRTPEVLEHLLAQVQAEQGKAGGALLARTVEEKRIGWAHARVVEYGRARAHSLNWPDVYTYTKALGERVAEDCAEDTLALSIVRPSIVESALRTPYTGWIDGFKMCDPAIMAYGRGLLPVFPGAPHGAFDVIPVDLVANALLVVAAHPPARGTVNYFSLGTSARNPLTFREFRDFVHEHFQRSPLTTPNRGPIRVPVPTMPGRRQVSLLLDGAERMVNSASRLLDALPATGALRGVSERLDHHRARVQSVRRLADLFGPYTEGEVIFRDDNAHALIRSLSADDLATLPCDVADIDWHHYWIDVHLPSIARNARPPAIERPPRPVQVRREAGLVLAVFDLEGTLLESNVVESFLWLRLAARPRHAWMGPLATAVLRLPWDLAVERRSRSEFLNGYYRQYRGMRMDDVARLAHEQIAEMLLRRLPSAAVRRVREHRAAGHRTVLVTGALDLFLNPLRPLFDDVYAASLVAWQGRYTGELTGAPVVGEARGNWVRAYASARGADLQRSYAYADSLSDLPMLRAVGRPVAVNPDIGLLRLATRRRWPIEEWHVKGGAGVLLPRGSRR
jgi:alcohol-forming fatty acyl-CoA reductase